MNFNKKVKGFFISSLTAIVAVCGVAFGVTYKNAAVKADETNGTVIASSELSKDVRAVYDAFNGNPLISGNSNQADYYSAYKSAYKVEYVQNATVNGKTVSGLRFAINAALSGKRVTVIQPNLLKINTSALSWNTPLFGFMMESRANKTDVGFELGPTLIGEDEQGFRLKVYESDIKNSERSAIRAYVVNGASNNGVTTDVNHYNGGTDVGGYYGAGYVYSTSVRKWVGNSYVDTFAESATAPFNFYYDNATNVAYCDASGDGYNTGWHLIRMFSEDPANYATHESPFPTEAGKSYGTGTGEATKFLGFKNNSARLGIRLIHGAGIGSYSFILTSYAGLDLTNPQNTLATTTNNFGVETENRTLAVKHGCVTSAVVGTEAKLPELNYVNRITGDVMSGECSVTAVNVYKARRSSGMEYTAYGATVTADELGGVVATVPYGGSYTFSEVGDYTLEYVSGSGVKTYFDYTVYDVSDEIKTIVGAINGAKDEYNSLSGAVTAEYVKNYVYNGATLNGIKISFDVTDGKSDALYLPLLVKTSALTNGKNTLGYIITPDAVGDRELYSFSPYLVSQDKTRVMELMHCIDNDMQYNGVHGVEDPSEPRSAVYLYASNNGVAQNYNLYNTVGVYYANSAQYNFAARGYKAASLNGYLTTPYNIQYDASLNALYGDISSGLHGQSNTYRFMRAFNVAPTEYSTITDPVSGKTLTDYTGDAAYTAMSGFGDYAYIGFRCKLLSGKTKGSFILTSYAGLDLTDPTAVSDNVLSVSDKNDVLYKDKIGEAVGLPEVKTVNKITGTVSGDFVGTVTVYKGAREDKYVKYGSLGAKSLDFPKEGGEAVNGLTYLGVAENGIYTFPASGSYTLVYTSSSGETEIKEVYVSKSLTLKLVAYNATLTDESGNPIEDGATVYSGQRLTVVPNAGYTLFNMGGMLAPSIFIGNKENDKIKIDGKNIWGKYEQLDNGCYVIKEEDETSSLAGTLNMAIAAYDQKYNVKFYRNETENAGVAADFRNIALYHGIPLSYWDGTNVWCLYLPNDFKPYVNQKTSKWYDTFGWDGERLSLDSYTWATSDYKDSSVVANTFGYYITYPEGSAQNSGLYKIGGNYKPIIDSDVTIEAALIRSFVDYTNAKIETNGTIGLSVKLGISKPDYDRLARMLGGETAFDMNAVITTGTVLDELGAGRKNAYHVTRDNPSGCVQAAINRTAVATETYNGKEYYVYTVKGVNIPKENYAKDYVFGGYVHYNCPNGGQVVRFGQGGAEFEKINVYKAACTTFGEGGGNVTTDTVLANSRVINGLTYYSDTLDERGIYFAVKYYYVGMYLTYVTETETEGYTKYELNGKTYYYDQTKVNSENIIRAIKFYNGVSLAEEV